MAYKAAKKKENLGYLVSAPVALPGDDVTVHNYRSKGAVEKWEEGVVGHVQTSWSRDSDT